VTAQDRPTARELVEAVREFLERDVLGATDGRVQFHVRVSVNALRMVERELARADDAGRTEREQQRALAAAIRDGSLDDRLDEVRAEVRAAVRGKLLVANPSYLPDDQRG
jgi:hypothetical protein